MDNFAAVNKIYEKYFPGENKPARSCVAVKTLPRFCKFEFEVIAYVPPKKWIAGPLNKGLLWKWKYFIKKD